MDRITTRIEEYVFVSDAKRAYERLAEYEDTGLTPEQILAMDEESKLMARVYGSKEKIRENMEKLIDKLKSCKGE